MLKISTKRILKFSATQKGMCHHLQTIGWNIPRHWSHSGPVDGVTTNQEDGKLRPANVKHCQAIKMCIRNKCSGA